MKRLTIVVLVTMMCVLSQAAVIMTDGFEAAENFAGNGWTVTDGGTPQWTLSTTTWGNPANYAWGGGDGVTQDIDSGTLSKDTGYVIQADDSLELTFDMKRLNPPTFDSSILVELGYVDGTGEHVLGSVEYLDAAIPYGWNNAQGTLTVAATAGAVGNNLFIAFSGGPNSWNSTSAQRIGIDNVVISVIAPPDLVPIADAGYSHVTWLDNGTLALAGTVDDSGEGDVIDTDVVWSIKTSPPGSAATLTKTSTDWANPTANFTPDSGIVGDYTIELTATDAAAQPDYDTLVVQVAADRCDATWLADELSIYDVNENCIIDLSDMAAFAAKWMSDMSLTGPLAY